MEIVFVGMVVLLWMVLVTAGVLAWRNRDVLKLSWRAHRAMKRFGAREAATEAAYTDDAAADGTVSPETLRRFDANINDLTLAYAQGVVQEDALAAEVERYIREARGGGITDEELAAIPNTVKRIIKTGNPVRRADPVTQNIAKAQIRRKRTKQAKEAKEAKEAKA